jgi:hypothetical protein
MKQLGKTIILVVAGLASCVIARAGNSDSYTTIAARNVFGLISPPVIVEPPPPEAPLPKITLDGFMTVFGRPQALYRVATQKNSPGTRGQDECCVFAEGEGLDGVKVMHIDMTSKTVTFSNHGTLQKISLTDLK